MILIWIFGILIVDILLIVWAVRYWRKSKSTQSINLSANNPEKKVKRQDFFISVSIALVLEYLAILFLAYDSTKGLYEYCSIDFCHFVSLGNAFSETFWQLIFINTISLTIPTILLALVFYAAFRLSRRWATR